MRKQWGLTWASKGRKIDFEQKRDQRAGAQRRNSLRQKADADPAGWGEGSRWINGVCSLQQDSRGRLEVAEKPQWPGWAGVRKESKAVHASMPQQTTIQRFSIPTGQHLSMGLEPGVGVRQ